MMGLRWRGLMKWGLVSNCCSQETAAAADLVDHTSAETGVWIETHTQSIILLYIEYLHNMVESNALSYILNITWKVDIKWGSQSTHCWLGAGATQTLCSCRFRLCPRRNPTQHLQKSVLVLTWISNCYKWPGRCKFCGGLHATDTLLLSQLLKNFYLKR